MMRPWRVDEGRDVWAFVGVQIGEQVVVGSGWLRRYQVRQDEVPGWIGGAGGHAAGGAGGGGVVRFVVDRGHERGAVDPNAVPDSDKALAEDAIQAAAAAGVDVGRFLTNRLSVGGMYTRH